MVSRLSSVFRSPNQHELFREGTNKDVHIVNSYLRSFQSRIHTLSLMLHASLDPSNHLLRGLI